ncbi:hypothetical protein WA026_021494 [Henosepilachna vigintioctopunctata]|uniref:Mpv17-like protein 2 n=1 Tax=Henosepilachna vigintioctopunctata TaxID=420089 RepID=A0AAW1UIW2_9CUCU
MTISLQSTLKLHNQKCNLKWHIFNLAMRYKFQVLLKYPFSYIQKTVNKAFSQKYLFYTNVFLSFSMSGAGDLVVQQYEITTGEGNEYSIIRTRNMSIYGCSAGVLTHFWYLFLDNAIPEKKTSREIVNEIRMKSMKLYITEWIVWPPAQFLNFYLVPSKFRILYDNAISFGYDIYYSRIKYR